MHMLNLKNLKNNQRFVVALLTGIISAIICALFYSIIVSTIRINFSIFYIAIGYIIGYSIKYFGRGIDIKFSILAVSSFFVSVFLCDIFQFAMTTGYMNIDIAIYCIRNTLISLSNFSVNNLIKDLFIFFSAYVAFYEARII